MFPSTATELETNSELNKNCYAILALHFPRRRYSKGESIYAVVGTINGVYIPQRCI